MRLRSYLPVIACVLTVTGCASSRPEPVVVTRVETLPIPPAALALCPRPVPLPDSDLSQQRAFEVMARDRTALRQCGRQIDAIRKAVHP